MNLNKYTKAELISKFKSLQTKQTNHNSNQTLFGFIITNLMYFKGLLLKITLFAFLIKSFKKYSLIRRIWMVINWTIVSVFGFSLMDQIRKRRN